MLVIASGLESGVSADILPLLGHKHWMILYVTHENKNRFQNRNGIDRLGGGHIGFLVTQKYISSSKLKEPHSFSNKDQMFLFPFLFPPWCKTHIVTC